MMAQPFVKQVMLLLDDSKWVTQIDPEVAYIARIAKIQNFQLKLRTRKIIQFFGVVFIIKIYLP